MDTNENKRSRKNSNKSSMLKERQQQGSNSLTKKKYKTMYDSEEEARLERAVFGDANDVIENLLGEDDSGNTVKDEHKLETKSIEDSDSENSKLSDSDNDDDDGDNDYESPNKKRKAWVDEDDNQYSVEDAFQAQNRKLKEAGQEKKYTQHLNKKFEQIYGKPKWAALDKKTEIDSDDSDSEILRHSNHTIVTKSKKLRKGTIELKAVTDINRKTHTEGPYISSIQFHPTSTVSLVAGSSGVLSLFEIDGKENNKLHSLKFQKFPINTARFLKDGTQIIVGSMSFAHCFTYDLISGSTRKVSLPHGITNMKRFEVSPDGKYIAICGRLGDIQLLSSVTKEIIHTFKMNKKCNALAFTPDSQKIISNGECSEMYVWDMRSNMCTHRAIDDGCLSAASIATSSSGQFIATGSKQGVVNIYDTNAVLGSENPQPLKMITNLVTSITSLKFNPTSEILACASSKKKNAFKLVHIPSFTVFANFPTFQTKIWNPLAIDFSPNSGFLGVSNNQGHAYLYRLKHYGNY